MSKRIDQIMAMDPMVRIAYEGSVFTVAVAEVYKPILGEGSPGATIVYNKLYTSEGVARKSHLDKYNEEVAHEIAKGRALKALAAKVLFGEKIRHRFMG